MEFDKSKILTSVTADQANGGDWGWFSDNISKMKRTVQEERPLRLAHIGGEDKVARFFSERCNLGWYLFYPAPYEYFQAKWVKENRLQVGDKVRVTKSWEYNERGFKMPCVTHYLVAVGSVIGINDDNINIQAEKFQASVPYFAIEKVTEPEYRPFASADEFAPHRDKWFRAKEGGDSFTRKVEEYCYDGVKIRGQHLKYTCFLDKYVFADTGAPAGVKV